MDINGRLTKTRTGPLGGDLNTVQVTWDLTRLVDLPAADDSRLRRTAPSAGRPRSQAQSPADIQAGGGEIR